MKRPDQINIHDYIYDLPDDRIAKFPLQKRDDSKLLVYEKGEIRHKMFKDIAEELPVNTLLVLNETKVIRARLQVQKASGTWIEVFLLQPLTPFADMQQALSVPRSAVWHCMIGNKKRFKEADRLELEGEGVKLNLEWENREEDQVRFTWQPPEKHFAEIVSIFGQMPIPPYLNRNPEETDKTVYQTVYSNTEGSVAAPTAGLHFTPEIFKKLDKKNIDRVFLTLHVGAGTFKPVKAENALEHDMHEERIFFSREVIQKLADHTGPVIPVGTTSLRSLESLYWFGAGLLSKELHEFIIPQYFPYNRREYPEAKAALHAVISYMDSHQLNVLEGATSIFIVPGYRPQIVKGIVTNFHQPASTLLLLISALTGDDWKKIYGEALAHDYRFLSYGDSSLLKL